MEKLLKNSKIFNHKFADQYTIHCCFITNINIEFHHPNRYRGRAMFGKGVPTHT